MLKLIAFFGILMLTPSIHSQEELEQGRYITSDKLKYITINENFNFEYKAFKQNSPFTIKEKREKENKTPVCGTFAYIVDIEGQGTGTYSIVDGNILLNFEIDFLTIATRPIDTKLLKGLTFLISKLEKLDN